MPKLIMCFFQSTDFNKTRYKVFKLDFTSHFQGNQTDDADFSFHPRPTEAESSSFGAQGYVFLSGEPNGSEEELSLGTIIVWHSRDILSARREALISVKQIVPAWLLPQRGIWSQTVK